MPNKVQNSMIREARRRFHQALLGSILTLDSSGIPSIADKDNKTSKAIARRLIDLLGKPKVCSKKAGQSLGAGFEDCVAAFIAETFPHLQHIRPGYWKVHRLGQRTASGIAGFDQYTHLDALAKVCKDHPEVETAMGRDYLICPDIIVSQMPLPDDLINAPRPCVDKETARHTSLRQVNNELPILHASISCKFTMRSDRAQNSRSEALNLIRSRKGRAPNIMVVIAEPLPSRLASLALGTGDLDCVYHFALPELVKAVTATGAHDALDLLNMMIEGRRLRDIADLPLDLAI